MDRGSIRNHSAFHNFVPTVTKFCVMREGLSLPHDTKFGNCRGEIVDRRVIFIWSLIHGSSWSGLIKVGPGLMQFCWNVSCMSVGLSGIQHYREQIHVLRTILVSHCPFVFPSVRLCWQNGVRSVPSTILVRFISYSHNLSTNLTRCVTC